jgi:hypothetical protein
MNSHLRKPNYLKRVLRRTTSQDVYSLDKYEYGVLRTTYSYVTGNTPPQNRLPMRSDNPVRDCALEL